MAWNLNAQMIETCSCNMMCPCWYGVQELMLMDQGWCATAMAFRIQDGASDGVSFGKRALVIAYDFPGPTLFDGNGTARLYVDDGASADQLRELEAIMQGKKGGPMEVLAPLTSKWLPTASAKIDVQEDGDTVILNVAGFGEVKSDLLKNDAGQQVTMQNAGMGVTMGAHNVELAPSGSRWSDPDMPRQFETKSGGRATVSWSA